MTKPKKEKEEKKKSPMTKEVEDIMVQIDRVKLESRELLRTLRKYGDDSAEYFTALSKLKAEREKLKNDL